MASEWYYAHGGERHGPVSTDQLKELAATGKITPEDLVWKDGMDNWVPAGKVKNLLPSAAPSAAPARAPARVADVERAPVAGMPADISHRKLAAGLTAIQAGSLGVHKFILGQNTAGLIALLVTVLTCGIGAGVMAIIGIFEGVTYLRMTDDEFYQTYIVDRKAWF